MITYEDTPQYIIVKLDGERVGIIGSVAGGWAYSPDAGDGKHIGETFMTIAEVKASLEE